MTASNSTNNNIACLTIYGTYVTAINSTNNTDGFFFFVSDMNNCIL